MRAPSWDSRGPLPPLAMQFGRFALVGAAGFIVDAGITAALVQLGWGPRSARMPAIAAAILLTWLANGRFAFRAGRGLDAGGLARYVAVASVAAAVNFGIYAILVLPLGSIPLAIVIATSVSMLLTFVGYRYLVFAR